MVHMVGRALNDEASRTGGIRQAGGTKVIGDP